MLPASGCDAGDVTAIHNAARQRGRPTSGGREASLDAGLAILRERGIANLTSREVARRAGVSDASVYYHYEHRAGLLRAVFAHGINRHWWRQGGTARQRTCRS